MAFDFDSGVGSSGSGISESYETVNKNIKAYPYDVSYIDGLVSVISYDTPSGAVNKTFAYSSGKLSSVTLSGATPGGIDLVKTFTYIGDSVSEVIYS